MRLSALLEEFERSLRRRDLSPNTIEAYHWALHDLIRTMTLEFLFDVSDLTREALEQWQDSQIDREWSARSRGLAVTAARQLIRYAIDKDLITDPKLERSLAKVKQPEMEPHPIPEADLEIIKAYYLAKPEAPTVLQLRDRALFFYILTTCGRVSEILQSRVDDYWAPIVIQKGGTKKTLGVPPEACALIREYLALRSDDRPELWLAFNKASYLRPMTPAQVRKVWKKIAKELGLDAWTTHEIRHTGATQLVASGVDHLVVANHMGHHGVATIAGYVKILDKSRQQVLTVMGGHMRSQMPSLVLEETAS